MALTRYTVISTVSAVYPPAWSEVVSGPASGAVATPAVPASTTAVQNANPFPVQVVITGGTLTAVIVGDVTVGTAAGSYIVPSAAAISITYSAAPTWAWSGAVSGPSAGLAETTQVAGTAPAGGQVGTLPVTTWEAGMAIEFDPATTAGAALLAAIGAGNLAAWIDGTSNVGHAGISN
jgi:hypothetical protein